MAGAGRVVNAISTVRLLLVSCITNGEQKHVILLQGSSGAEGFRSSPGQSRQESTESRFAASTADRVATNGARHRTGHAPITKSIRNEPNRWPIPMSVSPRSTRGKRRVLAMLGRFGADVLFVYQAYAKLREVPPRAILGGIHVCPHGPPGLDPDDPGPTRRHPNRAVAAGVRPDLLWLTADREDCCRRAPVYMTMFRPTAPINVGVTENRLGASATWASFWPPLEIGERKSEALPCN